MNWNNRCRYANRAKNIKNKPKINEDPKDALLREYQEEIERLKAMLVPGGNGKFEIFPIFMMFKLGRQISMNLYSQYFIIPWKILRLRDHVFYGSLELRNRICSRWSTFPSLRLNDQYLYCRNINGNPGRYVVLELSYDLCITEIFSRWNRGRNTVLWSGEFGALHYEIPIHISEICGFVWQFCCWNYVKYCFQPWPQLCVEKKTMEKD